MNNCRILFSIIMFVATIVSASNLLLIDTITIREKDENAAKNEAFEIARNNAAEHSKKMIRSVQRIENGNYSEEAEKTIFQMTAIRQYQLLNSTRRRFTFEVITETDTSAVVQKLMELYHEQKEQNQILVDSIDIKERERIEREDSIMLEKGAIIDVLYNNINEIQSKFQEYKSQNREIVVRETPKVQEPTDLPEDIIIYGIIAFSVIILLLFDFIRKAIRKNTNKEEEEDKINVCLLSLLIPIIGIVIFFAYIGKKPKKAIGALGSAILGLGLISGFLEVLGIN